MDKNQSMKILMIAPQPFFEPRGTPISVRQRLTGLSQLGHQVDLATYHLGEDVNLPGVKIFRTPVISKINALKVGPSLQKIPLDFLLILKSVDLLIRNKYDVIHTHEEAGFFSVFLAWIFNLTHIYDMHSSLPKQLVNFKFGDNKLMIGLFEYLEKLVINTCDAMITIGPDLEEYVREINPAVPMQMIENLPLNIEHSGSENPTQIKEEYGLQDGKILVYAGTFERYQGVDVLIESFDSVVRRYPDTNLVLLGGKPDQIKDCQELVSRLDLNGSVIFTGIVPIEDANTYIQLADILISPRIEGTSVPLKIYTYLHAGKPILATNIPAHSLVLNQDTALLVEPARDTLAEGLIRLLDDSELRKKLGTESKRLAEEKYGQAQYLAKLEKIYSFLQPSNNTKTNSLNPSRNGQ